MIRILKLLLVLLAAGLLLLFFWQNKALLGRPLPVVLRLPLVEIRPLPPHGPRIDLMLVIALAAGFAVGYGLGVLRRLQSALELRRLRKELAARPAPTSQAPEGAPSTAVEGALTAAAAARAPVTEPGGSTSGEETGSNPES